MKRKCKFCGARVKDVRCDYCGAIFDDRQTTETPKTFNNSLIIGIVVTFVVAFMVAVGFLLFMNARSQDSGGASNRPASTEENTLIGTWGNGRGMMHLLVFRHADYVEFLEDGTLIIINGESRWASEWEHVGAGAFIADGERFGYTIEGDTLTLTDSWEDDWAFERIDEMKVDFIPPNATLDETDLIGAWDWDLNRDVIYYFNEDGAGSVRSINSRSESGFDWEIIDGNTILMHFADETQHWAGQVENNVLTLADLESYNIWQYLRINEEMTSDDVNLEQELSGTWHWDIDSTFIYTFNSDGTGNRGLGSDQEHFEWQVLGGQLQLEFNFVAMFGVESEAWMITFENGTLTLTSRQGGGIHRYVR